MANLAMPSTMPTKKVGDLEWRIQELEQNLTTRDSELEETARKGDIFQVGLTQEKETVKRLEGSIEFKDAQIARAISGFYDKDSEVGGLKSQLVAKDHQYRTAKEEVEDLRSQLVAKDDEYRTANEAFIQVSDTYTELRTEVDNKNTEIQELQNEVSVLQQTSESRIQELESNLEAKDSEIEQTKKEGDSLASLIMEKNDLQRELSVLSLSKSEKIQFLEKEVARLISLGDNWEYKWKSHMDAKNISWMDTSEVNQKTSEAVKSLESKLNDQEERIEGRPFRGLIRGLLGQKNVEATDLSSQHRLDIDKKNAEIEMLRKEADTLEQTCTASQSRIQELEENLEDRENRLQNISQEKEQLNGLEIKLVDTQRKLEAAEQEKNDLEIKLIDTQRKMKAAEQEKRDLEHLVKVGAGARVRFLCENQDKHRVIGAKENGNILVHRGDLFADISLFKTNELNVHEHGPLFYSVYGVEIETWMDENSETTNKAANYEIGSVLRMIEYRGSMSHMGSFTKRTLDEWTDKEFGKCWDQAKQILKENPELHKLRPKDAGGFQLVRLDKLAEKTEALMKYVRYLDAVKRG